MITSPAHRWALAVFAIIAWWSLVVIKQQLKKEPDSPTFKYRPLTRTDIEFVLNDVESIVEDELLIHKIFVDEEFSQIWPTLRNQRAKPSQTEAFESWDDYIYNSYSHEVPYLLRVRHTLCAIYKHTEALMAALLAAIQRIHDDITPEGDGYLLRCYIGTGGVNAEASQSGTP